MNNCDIEILDSGRTIREVIDSKIKEFDIGGNEEPFYVLNLDSVFQRHLRWLSNLPRVKPFYAVKCNNTEAVLRGLIALDTGFDCASKAEIQLALSLGMAPDKIIYAHTTKPMSHIRYARTHGIDMMTFDGEDELLKISLCHPKARLVLRIAVDDSESLGRLSSKFGARMVSVGKLLERAVELGLNVIGVSFHVGTGCNGRLAFKKAIADARRVFDMGSLLGFQMSLLDIGGGFSGRDDFQVKFEEMAEDINGALEEFFPPDSGVQIIAEPGRFLVESSFTLATNVIAKRVIFDDMDEHCGLDYIREQLEDPSISPNAGSGSSDEEDFFHILKSSHKIPSATKQFDSYLAYSTDDIKILKTFPVVLKLSVKLNTPLPASAACESLFSIAGLIFSPKEHGKLQTLLKISFC